MSTVVSATAVDVRRIRVVFSATVPDTDPTAAGDATNPANYTFVGQAPGPTAAVVAASCVVFGTTNTTIDVLTDQDLSWGKNYQLTAKPASSGGITGLITPGNQQVFPAFTPVQPAARAFNISDMIPRKNWREDDTGDLAKFVSVLQDQTNMLINTVDRWTDILDAAICPSGFVGAMLSDLGNPFGAIALTEAQQRQLVAELISIYQEKGTAKGIRDVIRFFFGFEARVLRTNSQGVILNGDLNLPGGPGGATDLLRTAFVLGGYALEYSFTVLVGTPGGRALDPVTEAPFIAALVDYMRPAHTTCFAINGDLPPPATVTATAGSGQISVAWSAVTGETGGYRVYYRPTSNVNPFSANHHDVSHGTTTWIETTGDGTGLVAGRAMFYTVAAIVAGSPSTPGVWSTPEVSATAT